ncbi:MipA/OmpV family protein [Sphingomonas paeninsulae]|jgi:outer membrane protein|uniref:MipA/OmpV family protein n=1 Tax=Sphingomonas paeninsulae TaxID=2319844 RepID=A0A494TAN9_SPHPE|nr:MipA/OmpV family protein [Sphingomonas paeninsulae]AYJ86407.1 MipA/OmpV family protein [Sphingomonas paeninsulae]
MRYAFLLLAATTIATPALAQDAGPPKDSITIGVGAAYVPRYEGSSDNTVTPAAAARGTISGIGFMLIGTTLYTDFVPETSATGGKLVLGPVVHVTLNRTSNKRTRDFQVAALGELDPAVEIGGQIGYSQTGVITSDYDTVSLTVGAVHDVSGVHDSYIITPQFSYGTPLSPKIYVGLNVSADYVGGKYAQTYFGVTPGQSIASGLATYTPGDGFKDVSAGLGVNYSLTGDLRHGLSLFAVGSYERLLGDFARSPVVNDRSQLIGAAGLAYTF